MDLSKKPTEDALSPILEFVENLRIVLEGVAIVAYDLAGLVKDEFCRRIGIGHWKRR